MKVFSASLTNPWMEKRMEIPTLSKTLRNNIQNAVSDEVNNDGGSSGDHPVSKKRRYSGFCPSKIRRMSKMICCKCDTPLCGDHKNLVCNCCI